MSDHAKPYARKARLSGFVRPQPSNKAGSRQVEVSAPQGGSGPATQPVQKVSNAVKLRLTCIDTPETAFGETW